MRSCSGFSFFYYIYKNNYYAMCETLVENRIRKKIPLFT